MDGHEFYQDCEWVYEKIMEAIYIYLPMGGIGMIQTKASLVYD